MDSEVSDNEPLEKYEFQILARAMGLITKAMQESRFVGEEDPHLKKCKDLQAKVEKLAQ